MTAHDSKGKEVVDSILKKFKEGAWECNGGMGRGFYRTGTSKTFPSPDHAFANDDANKIRLTFEYKPDTEKKRGILTGLGQSIAYLNASDISYLVIPKTLVENNYDIQLVMSEIFENSIVGILPVGLIVFDNDDPSDVSMIHNVESLLGREPLKQIDSGRFWAKHQDLPIPLFHLILHYYYLRKTDLQVGNPLANCWNERLWNEESLRTFRPVVVEDIRGEVIMTPGGRKEFSVMDDYLEIEKDTKTLKSINLDDFSIEDLKDYIEQLKKEIERVKNELEKKQKSQIEAEKYFK